MNKSMMLVTGSWGNNKTFKMIPIEADCPYNEAIFDRDSKVLALIGKEKKQSMHMVAKLDDHGDVKTMKVGRRANGKDYAEERKTLESYYEYYIENPEDIKDIVNSFAINADVFDYAQYMEQAYTEAPSSNLITV
jgi:hypothetical protein